jgi:sigma-B regulation protein RsbU (phosphoserine phosphatase)
MLGRLPAQVLEGLNAMFDMDQHGGMYFTIWYGVYDADSRTLLYSSGGHHPAFLVPPERSDAIPLHTRNIAVGSAPDYAFKSGTVQVPPGSVLYLFSDGVFEIVTAEGAEWRLQEFIPLLLQPPSTDLSEPQRLHESVKRVALRDIFDDDFSLLVARFP